MEGLIFELLRCLMWEGFFVEGRSRVNLLCSSSLLLSFFSIILS